MQITISFETADLDFAKQIVKMLEQIRKISTRYLLHGFFSLLLTYNGGRHLYWRIKRS